MPRVEDVTARVIEDSSRGPGEHRARVAKAKPAKALTPTLQATLDDWLRKADRSLGYTSGPLAYGFRWIKPSAHNNMIRLIKGGHLRVCQVHAPPPKPSNAYSSSPYADRYYIIREACPAEVAEGTLYGTRKRRKARQ